MGKIGMEGGGGREGEGGREGGRGGEGERKGGKEGGKEGEQDLAVVHHIISQDDVHGTGELSCWCLLRHLLDAQRLVVLVHRQSILRLQGIPLLILSCDVTNIQVLWTVCLTLRTDLTLVG